MQTRQEKSSAADLLLADAGGSLALVVLRRDAAPAEAFAAEELRRCLAAMTGADPEQSRSRGTRIVLNDVRAAEAAGIRRDAPLLGREQFHIETRGADVHILGGSPRAVLYGAYELLEMLGCRWLTPENELIPRHARVTLGPLRLTAGPAFEYRDLWGSDPDDELWRVRNRFNGHSRNLPEHLGGNERYGLWVHTFYQLVPPEEFFSAHPDYFSMIEGVRRHEGAQLCLSSPGVLDIVTERVLERMRANPAARYFSVSPNDWFNPCDCPDCRRAVAETGAQSGSLLRFVNAVAERTSREFPDRLVDTLAYQYTLEAPHGVAVHPNVRIRICPIFCCQAHPFGTCEQAESKRFLEAFRGWSRLTDQLYVWHYFPNFAHFHLPMPNFEELAGNARFYSRMKVRGLFWQGERYGESVDLRRYLMARLAWDPDRDQWAIVDEWLRGMYGSGAAAALRPYYDLFHGRVRENRSLCVNCVCPPGSPLFDETTLARAEQLIEAAGPICREDAARKHLEMLSTSIAYTRLYRKGETFRLAGDTYRGDATEADLAEFDRLVPRLRESGYNTVRFGDDFRVVRARFLAHPVLRTGAGRDSVAAVPSLGARLLEWHAAGRQWLNPSDPEDDWTLYPYNGGYMESASVAGGEVSAEKTAHRGGVEEGALAFRLDLGSGVTLERDVRVNNGELDLRTTFRRGSTGPLECAWNASWRLHAPDFTEVSIDWAGGRAIIRADDLPDGLFNGRVVMTDGASRIVWTVSCPGVCVQGECEAGGLSRIIVGRCARIGLLAVDLRAGGSIPDGSGQVVVQRLMAKEGAGR